MIKTRKDNGAGSTRKLANGQWECIIQSKYMNPKTGNPKRIKRQGKTEAEATKKAQTELKRWEKQIESGFDTKQDKENFRSVHDRVY